MEKDEFDTMGSIELETRLAGALGACIALLQRNVDVHYVETGNSGERSRAEGEFLWMRKTLSEYERIRAYQKDLEYSKLLEAAAAAAKRTGKAE